MIKVLKSGYKVWNMCRYHGFRPQFIIIRSNPKGITSILYAVEERCYYFIDRDPKHFPKILNYRRNKAIFHSDILPRDLKISS
jgi:hypothetical protein